MPNAEKVAKLNEFAKTQVGLHFDRLIHNQEWLVKELVNASSVLFTGWSVEPPEADETTKVIGQAGESLLWAIEHIWNENGVGCCSKLIGLVEVFDTTYATTFTKRLYKTIDERGKYNDDWVERNPYLTD